MVIQLNLTTSDRRGARNRPSLGAGLSLGLCLLSLVALPVSLIVSSDPAHASATISSIESAPFMAEGHSSNMIVIRVTEEAAGAILAGIAEPERQGTVQTGLEPFDRLLRWTKATGIEPTFDTSPTAIDPDTKRAHGLHRFFTVHFEGKDTPRVEGLGILYRGHEIIERAELVRTAHIMSRPNDELYAEQWSHHNESQVRATNGLGAGRFLRHFGDDRVDYVGAHRCDLNTPRAWDRSFGNRSVTLALLDTGIDLTHPEFRGRLMPGHDFVNDDDDPSDDHGHGTACAGIAAAQGDNRIGIAGVAWQCRILPIKVLDENGVGLWLWVAQGIIHAADHGAQVLSMSLGGDSSMIVEAAVDYAWSKNCVLFAASGNVNDTRLLFPARLNRVSAVGALSPCNERKSPSSCDREGWWGSNHGPGLDFLAPGVSVVTTDMRGEHGYTNGDYFPAFTGTSAATAHAAGVAVLVKSAMPGLSNLTVLERMRMSCTDVGAPGVDPECGYGRLNAYRALRFRNFDPENRLWEEERTVVETVATRAETLRKALETENDRTVGACCFTAGSLGIIGVVVRRWATTKGSSRR